MIRWLIKTLESLKNQGKINKIVVGITAGDLTIDIYQTSQRERVNRILAQCGLLEVDGIEVKLVEEPPISRIDHVE